MENGYKIAGVRIAVGETPVTIDEFWDIVDRVHLASGGDMETKCQLLQAELENLSLEEVLSFNHYFDDCEDKAYDWDLWAAAYIIGGGCSNDSFSDFCATLISMGRETFEKVVALPDSLADMECDNYESFYEGYQYIRMNVFIDMTGGELPGRAKPSPSDPSGEKWDYAELPRICPKVWQKHGWTKN